MENDLDDLKKLQGKIAILTGELYNYLNIRKTIVPCVNDIPRLTAQEIEELFFSILDRLLATPLNPEAEFFLSTEGTNN
jgi:hypothetical protein